MDDCVIRRDRFEKEFSQGERGFMRVEGYRYGDPAGRGDRLPWK